MPLAFHFRHFSVINIILLVLEKVEASSIKISHSFKVFFSSLSLYGSFSGHILLCVVLIFWLTNSKDPWWMFHYFLSVLTVLLHVLLLLPGTLSFLILKIISTNPPELCSVSISARKYLLTRNIISRVCIQSNVGFREPLYVTLLLYLVHCILIEYLLI